MSPVPAGQPAPRQILPRVRRPPRARLRLVWRRTTRAAPASASSAATRSPLALRTRFVRLPRRRTPPSTSPRRSSPPRPPWRASASRSPCSSPTSRARWSCSPTATPRRPGKLLDPVLERMMEAVHRYEGTVNQVMGDGIMALFGAPLAHEDHAVRACYAALRDAGVRRSGTRTRSSARTGVPIQIRVGPQLRRGGRPRHRQRSAHGLHGRRARRPTWPPAWSSWPRPGTILLAAAHPAPRRGLRRRSSRSGPVAGQGLAGPRGGLRAHRSERVPRLGLPRGGRARG